MTSKQIAVTVAVPVALASILVGGIVFAATHHSSDNTATQTPSTVSNIPNISNLSISEYLSKAHISTAQEKAFNITNNLGVKDHFKISTEVSSYRYPHERNKESTTPLEQELDQDVRNGDLPLPNFTVEDMKVAKNNIAQKSDKNVQFVLCPGSDTLKLHEQKYLRDGDIVNLASQFNALESVSNAPSSVKIWKNDNSQGPRCALQAVAATKHREAAHLQGKLTDALEEALQHCIVDGKPITEKYPELYQGGYLEMMRITDTNDMEKFLEFLNSENGLEKYMKVLMQWVKCEGSEKKQLQFFTAAPSFQDYSKELWNAPYTGNKLKRMQLIRKACVRLVEIQYRAMAQAAAIISAQTGKNVRLHVSMIGHGCFNNPKETVPAALKALKEELQGVDATVFLHNRPSFMGGGNIDIWKAKGDLDKLGINPTPFEKWKY